MLWRHRPRDRVRLDAWENIAGGLYRDKDFAGFNTPVIADRRLPTSRGNNLSDGQKAGYMELVIAAALEWRLPGRTLNHLGRFLPKRSAARRWRSLKEYGWT